MDGELLRAFDYYLAHQAELVKQYEGRVVVIADDTVLGVFDDDASAVAAIGKVRPIGSFLVQRVTGGDTGYSQTFHSRVSFA